MGKQLLKSNRKMYMMDLGLQNHILPRRRYDLGFSIENMVYFELLRRGYQVAIGKNGTVEVDFVARKQGILTYYQVTADLTAEETLEREMRPLQSILDNDEKIILTLDCFTLGNYDGIMFWTGCWGRREKVSKSFGGNICFFPGNKACKLVTGLILEHLQVVQIR